MAGPEMRLGLPVVGFDDADAFDHWLATEPRSKPGIWLKLARKGAGAI